MSSRNGFFQKVSQIGVRIKWSLHYPDGLAIIIIITIINITIIIIIIITIIIIIIIILSACESRELYLWP